MTPHRILFWQIQHVWLFYLLAAVAVGVFIFGLISHVRIWARGVRRQGIPFSWNSLSNIFLDGFLGRRIFKGDIAAGTMHFFILWGFLGLFAGTVFMTVDYWIYNFIKGPIYVLYSICLEILGLMLMIGLIWAVVRRYIQRVQRSAAFRSHLRETLIRPIDTPRTASGIPPEQTHNLCFEHAFCAEAIPP